MIILKKDATPVRTLRKTQILQNDQNENKGEINKLQIIIVEIIHNLFLREIICMAITSSCGKGIQHEQTICFPPLVW